MWRCAHDESMHFLRQRTIYAAEKKAAEAASAVKPVKSNRLERNPKSDVVELSKVTNEVDDFFLVPEKESVTGGYIRVTKIED